MTRCSRWKWAATVVLAAGGAAAVMTVGIPSVQAAQRAVKLKPVAQPDTRPGSDAGEKPPAEGPTAPKAEPSSSAEIDALLVKLSDGDWRVRKQAVEELVRVGPGALEALKRASVQAERDEARTAALSAIQQIEESQLIGPSLLTLHVKEVPARKALDEIARQSHAPLKLQSADQGRQANGNEPRVTIDADREPFWKVMERFQTLTGLEYRLIDGEPRMTDAGGMTRGRAHVVGAFLVSVDQLTRMQSVNFSNGQSAVRDDFGIGVTIFPEPKLRVLEASPLLKLKEVVDDHGNSLIPKQGGAPDEMTQFGQPMGEAGFSFYSQLKYPKENAGDKITRFAATASFKVQIRSDTISMNIKDMGKSSKTVLDTPVTFRSIVKEDESWRLHLLMGTTEQSPAWVQLEPLMSGVKVLDAAGQPLVQEGYNVATPGDASMELVVNYGRTHRSDGRQSGEPVRIVWEIPTATRDIEVPVEFDGLKMPS